MSEKDFKGKYISVIDKDYDYDPHFWVGVTGAHDNVDTARRKEVYYQDAVWVRRSLYSLEPKCNHELEKRQTGELSAATVYLVKGV